MTKIAKYFAKKFNFFNILLFNQNQPFLFGYYHNGLFAFVVHKSSFDDLNIENNFTQNLRGV